jgi:hypothetical protein
MNFAKRASQRPRTSSSGGTPSELKDLGCLELGRPLKTPLNAVEMSKEQHEVGKARVWRK